MSSFVGITLLFLACTEYKKWYLDVSEAFEKAINVLEILLLNFDSKTYNQFSSVLLGTVLRAETNAV